jgi:hypothetical protein
MAVRKTNEFEGIGKLVHEREDLPGQHGAARKAINI